MDGIQSYMLALTNKDSPRQYVRYLTQSAETGYQPAMLALADHYYSASNINKAVQWYGRLAENGIAHAMYRLGLCYISMGDRDQGIRWLSDAVRNGDIDALYAISEYGEVDENVINGMFDDYLNMKDYTSAWRICNISKNTDDLWKRMVDSSKDNPQNLINEVDSCIEVYLKNDPKGSFQWHLRCSMIDDADSMYIVGMCYLYGTGVERSLKDAMAYFVKASELDNYRSMYRVGRMYQLGMGVDESKDKALEWFSRIPMIDYPMASYRMAEIKGVEGIFDELGTDFIDLLELFAKGNDAESQYYLGQFYHWLYSYDDVSLSSIDKRSLTYYRRSAENGYPEAQNLMGLISEYGTDSIKPSVDDAVTWFTLASERHLGDGEYNLALLYIEGKGVEKSEKKAKFLLNKAIEDEPRMREKYQKVLSSLHD